THRAVRPSVRSCAERMVADHGRANAELAALAGRKDLDMPTALEPSQQAMRAGDLLGSGSQGVGGALAADAARPPRAGATGELGSRARSCSGAGGAAGGRDHPVVPGRLRARRGLELRKLPAGEIASSRRATASPGRDERWGVWGAISGPPTVIARPFRGPTSIVSGRDAPPVHHSRARRRPRRPARASGAPALPRRRPR